MLISVYFLFRQLRLQRYSHLIQSVENLVGVWNLSQFLNLRGRVCSKLPKDKSYFGSNMEERLRFFEQLGQYEKLKAIPQDNAWSTFSWFIDYYYELCGDEIYSLRMRHKDDLLLENFDYLARAMKRESRRFFQRLPIVLEDETIAEFLKVEIETSKLLLSLPDRKGTII